MEIEDTKKVAHLSDASHVNQYLDAGWKLMEIYIGGYGRMRERNESVYFVVGWMKDKEPEEPNLIDSFTGRPRQVSEAARPGMAR